MTELWRNPIWQQYFFAASAIGMHASPVVLVQRAMHPIMGSLHGNAIGLPTADWRQSETLVAGALLQSQCPCRHMTG